MVTTYSIIRKFNRIVAAEKLALHAVKIAFIAPPKTSSETYDIKKQKAFEANFQWTKYSLLVSNTNKTEWYTYIVDLEPWGTKRKGTEEVIAADHSGALLKGAPINVDPKEIEDNFPKLLKDINLDPDLPESMVTYINGHEKDKGKKYTPIEFSENFENSKTEKGTHFYILISKSNELKTPFGKLVGKDSEIK